MTADPENGTTAGRRRVAAFDVDGTLTTRDCVVAFLRRIAGTPRLVAGLLRHPFLLGRGLLARDRDALKALAADAAFAGRAVADVELEATGFAGVIASSMLRADTLDALRRHQAAGDLTVFVSASFEVYLDPLADLLGVDAVLGTRLGAADGVLDGTLEGNNCRGAEKVVRLHAMLDDLVGGRNGAEVIAYGDSAGDRFLLADADEGHWMGRYRP